MEIILYIYRWVAYLFTEMSNNLYKQELRIVHRGRLQMMDLLNPRVLQFTSGLADGFRLCTRAIIELAVYILNSGKHLRVRPRPLICGARSRGFAGRVFLTNRYSQDRGLSK